MPPSALAHFLITNGATPAATPRSSTGGRVGNGTTDGELGTAESTRLRGERGGRLGVWGEEGAEEGMGVAALMTGAGGESGARGTDVTSGFETTGVFSTGGTSASIWKSCVGSGTLGSPTLGGGPGDGGTHFVGDGKGDVARI